MNLKELKEKYTCIIPYNRIGVDVLNKYRTELIGHIKGIDMPQNETDEILITSPEDYVHYLKNL